jgi:hypothetical protein
LNEAFAHVTVRWQLSQDIAVGRWVAGLPWAMVLLWHRAQLPGAMPLCVKKAGFQLVVLWQLLQLAVVGK